MDADKKKMVMIAVIGGVAIIGFLFFAFTVMLGGGKKGSAEEVRVESAKPSIPDANNEELYTKKSQAYANSSDFDDKNVDEIWASLASKEDAGKDGFSEDMFKTEPASSKPEENPGKKNVRRDSTPRDTGDEDLIVTQKVQQPKQSYTSNSSGRRTSTGSKPTQPAVTQPVQEQQPASVQETTPAPKPRKKASDWNSTATGAFSSLSNTDDYEMEDWDSSDNGFIRCCFAKDMKVVNGQRITIRLLQDLFINDALIPANSRITATCQLSDRLNVIVSGFEINGRIFDDKFIAYDLNDGNPGIYCPSVSQNNSKLIKRQAINEGVSAVSSVLGRDGGVIGSLGSRAVSTGQQIANSAIALTEVSVVSGYEFYIKRSER